MEYFVSRRKLSGRPLKFRNAPSKTPTYAAMQITAKKSKTGTSVISQADWAKKVVANSRNGQVLFVVHGYNVQQKSFVHEVAKIRQTLQGAGYRGSVVGFDWPSDGNFARYWSDRKDAEATADGLIRDGIIPLLRRKPGLKISILAHSMGAHVVSRALSNAAKGPQAPALKKALNEVVFTSAEINQDHFKVGGWAINGFAAFRFRFTSYWSGADQVLKFREEGFQKPTLRFGRHMSVLPPSKLHDAVDCTGYYQKTYKRGPHFRKSHSFYYNDSVFYADLVATITGAAKNIRPFRVPAAGGHQALK